MKTVGVIAEYNPFHNGHKFQLEKAKELTGADYCIVIMSGDFMQRGAPAIIDKYARTEAALLCGADLVIELPVYYATASAEYFAQGATALLEHLDADCLCFGSECGDIEILSEIADVLTDENDIFKETLKRCLKQGASYPRARNSALCAAKPELTPHIDVLNFPNNILGIEYLKALKKSDSRITPFTISRAVNYHDSALHASYSSALALRSSIISENGIGLIKEQVPAAMYEILKKEYLRSFPIVPDDLSLPLNCKLLAEQDSGFEKYFDVDKNFSNKLKKYIARPSGYSAACDTLKSKNMTYTRVARSLLHILLNIYQSELDACRSQNCVYYARILGFRKDSEPLLGLIKNAASIPLISKLADAASYIEAENGLKMLKADIRAASLYSLIVQQKYGAPFCSEYERGLVIICNSSAMQK